MSYGLALYGVDRAVGRAVRTAAAALMTVALVTPAVRASWTVVNLHPSGWYQSYAYGVAGGQQVGTVYDYYSYIPRAALWSGSASSFVDLHPSGWYESYAYGVAGGQQVGYVYGSIRSHAALWSGSASSFVDLHPSEWYQSSFAFGVAGGQQVGYVYGSIRSHAALWSGSASSFVDLHPTGWYRSRAWGVASGLQVGTVYDYSDNPRAALWSGSASSFVNLHAFLGPEFTSSEARSITQEHGFTYVVGFGFNSYMYRWEALMWVIPEPVSLLGLGLALALFPRRR